MLIALESDKLQFGYQLIPIAGPDGLASFLLLIRAFNEYLPRVIGHQFQIGWEG